MALSTTMDASRPAKRTRTIAPIGTPTTAAKSVASRPRRSYFLNLMKVRGGWKRRLPMGCQSFTERRPDLADDCAACFLHLAEYGVELGAIRPELCARVASRE